MASVALGLHAKRVTVIGTDRASDSTENEDDVG
jgi:hypothetical protein